MNTPNNLLFSKYLSAEASATGDWLRLSVMLVLLVLARMVQPQPQPATAVPALRTYPQYLLPVGADSSQLSPGKLIIYNMHYNTQALLGRLTRH